MPDNPNRGPSQTRSARVAALFLAFAGALGLVACGNPTTPGSANLPPVAVFTVDVTTGAAPLTVAFDANGSSDPDGVIVSFAWQFGDGSTAAGATTSHTYVADGSYTARLTVTDDRGASASTERVIVVGAGAGGGGDDHGNDGGGDGDGGNDGGGDGDGGNNGGGDGDGNNGGGDGDGGNNGGGDGDEGLTAAAFSATNASLDTAYDLPRLVIITAVDMALEATRQNAGALTLTGSLEQAATDTFTYAAEPNDRLRLALLDGRVFEVVFRAEPQGDGTGDGARYFRNPHAIDVRLSSNPAAGALDLTVVSRPGEANNTQVMDLAGTYTPAGGSPWTAELAIERFQRSEVDFGGNELETIIRISGQVASEPAGVSVAVNRYYRYILVNTAENFDVRVDHTIAAVGRQYRFAGRVFVGLLNSKPVDRDQWVIEGGLAEGEQLVAQVTATEDVTGLSVWLDFGGDQRSRLLFYGYL